MLLCRSKMDDVLSFPKGRHRPADPLLGMRDGFTDRNSHRFQSWADSIILHCDVCVDRFRFDAEMLLILF
jgi:hypothetical protein